MTHKRIHKPAVLFHGLSVLAYRQDVQHRSPRVRFRPLQHLLRHTATVPPPLHHLQDIRAREGRQAPGENEEESARGGLRKEEQQGHPSSTGHHQVDFLPCNS